MFSKGYLLATPNVMSFIQDPNGNNPIFPSIIPLPTNLLGPVVQSYLLNNETIYSFFTGNIQYYKLLDNPQRTLPFIAIYPISDIQDGELGTLSGIFKIELVIPLYNKRNAVVDDVKFYSDYVFLALNSTDLANYAAIFCPGLWEVGANITWNNKESIGTDPKNPVDAYVVEGEMHYKINLLNYYLGIQSGYTYEYSNITINPVAS